MINCQCIEVVTPTVLPIIEIECLLLPGFFKIIPVDFLFIVNTLENIFQFLTYVSEKKIFKEFVEVQIV